MSSYWINFARKDDPNWPGLPVWPAFNEQERKTMVFDKTASAKPHPNFDKIRAGDAYFAKEREEAKGNNVHDIILGIRGMPNRKSS